MQAFLIVGTGDTEKEINKIITNVNALRINTTIAKIEDVRIFRKTLSLHISEPTAFVVSDFGNATLEAQNALLKSLEEPQENVYFILCVRFKNLVLPTIASRCQIINIGQSVANQTDIDNAEKFFKLNKNQQLSQVSKITNRDQALEFLESLITGGEKKLRQDEFSEKWLDATHKCYQRVKANGNIPLQFSAFISSLD